MTSLKRPPLRRIKLKRNKSHEKSDSVCKLSGRIKPAAPLQRFKNQVEISEQHLEEKTSGLTALRKEAQKQLTKQSERIDSLSKKDIKHLINELGTHQIELEMQNEELRRAGRAFETSQAKYADLYDFSPVGYFTFDRKGLIQELNLTGANMLGMGKRSLLAKPFQNFIEPVGRAVFRDHLSAVFTTHTNQTCEIKIRTRDGSVSPVQLHSLALRIGDGDPGVCRTAVSDVTERKLTEGALKESEKRHRLLFENMLDGFAYCKMLYDNRDHPIDFIYLHVNSAFERLTGLTNVEGKKVSEVIPGIKESNQELIETYSRVALTGTPEKFEIEFKPLAAWLSVSVYSTERGYFTAVFDNITGRKRAESIMQARSRMLEATTAAMSVDTALQMTLDEIEAQTGSEIGFYHFLDADQETLSLQTWSTNTLRKMCTAKGKGSHYNISQAGVWVDCVRERRPVIHNDYVALPHRRGLPPGHALVIREMVVPILRGGRITAIIGVGNKSTDYNTTDVEIATLLGELSWEIVERIKAEEQLKQTSTNLALVNRELEAFSYSVSHDLRAPLRSIEGFTTAILEDHAASLDNTAKDYFQRVTSASRLMSQLIEAMLNMSRLTRTELQENIVNLSDLAEVVVHELRKREPDRKVEFIIAKDVKVRGDISLLRAVLENLLGNSWKFSAKQPSATIEFGSTQLDGRDVYFVRDDGAGFSMDYAYKLFTPFRRLHTESEFPGIGIGLATTQRIIHRHGGRIWAEGEVDMGATFYFTLQ